MIRFSALALVLAFTTLSAQSIKKQVRDGAPQLAMTSTELSVLGDPLFRLVLKTKPNEIRFDEVVRLLKGTTGGTEHFFVVDEKIIDPAIGQSRRAVIGFKGSNQGLVLVTNVMLSVFFDSNTVQPGFIEAWGWDNKRSRYNYYRLDKEGGTVSWKFRGSSIDADKLTQTQRNKTCMACHLNGGPVMKELPFPWNNWNSFQSQSLYLRPGGAGHWTIAEGSHLATLEGAESMETDFILPALKQFNGRRIDQLTKKNADGTASILDGKRALRSLFETTEFNAISSDAFSGLHPFQGSAPGLPSGVVKVPDTFFLNANLFAGGKVTQYQGLGIDQARDFASVLVVQPAEYRKLVNDAATKLNNTLGDSSFAWFVPEASHSDNHMVDRLIINGVITQQFAAAVLAVDVENPVFSLKTPALLQFIPKTFRFNPRVNDSVATPHPDELTKAVIAALQATSPVAGSPQADFLALLKAPNPVTVLRQRVQAYLTREQAALANVATREAELKRLFDVVLSRRQEALTNPLFKQLNETGNLLFAVP